MTTQYGNVNDTAGYAQAFYSAYDGMIKDVLQEQNDVYAGLTQVDTLEGEKKAYDFLGTIDLTEKATRFEDIPIEDMDHNRRWIAPRWFRKGIFWDPEDGVALFSSILPGYIRALGKGVTRTKNDIIYAAFEASVQGGKDWAASGADTYAFNDAAFDSSSEGGRTIVHDTTNAYAVGGTSSGMTIEKLVLAREALVQLKNDPNEVFNIVCSQRQISQLFREAETQSLDTSPFRSLADGHMMQFHGFRFIVDYNVTVGSSNDIDADTNIYPCYAFTNDALLFAQHERPIFNVDWLPRKQIYQISARVGMCAARMDEDKIIKIECIA